MNKIIKEFISEEKKDFKFRIGNTLASALTGFIAGAVSSVIILYVGYSLLFK